MSNPIRYCSACQNSGMVWVEGFPGHTELCKCMQKPAVTNKLSRLLDELENAIDMNNAHASLHAINNIICREKGNA